MTGLVLGSIPGGCLGHVSSIKLSLTRDEFGHVAFFFA